MFLLRYVKHFRRLAERYRRIQRQVKRSGIKEDTN